MQLTPELKAQMAEQKKQCVYCKIVAREIPGKIVFEDRVTIGILDIYPAKKGHLVFTLKEHYPIVPLIPAEEFAHFFGLAPQLSKALQSAMVATGVNLFIANGGAAGQSYPHFLGHFFPRDQRDGFFNFLFKPGKSLEAEKVNAVQRQLLGLMQNYFAKNPRSWHTGLEEIPSFLQQIEKEAPVLYQDEKVLCVLPQKSAVPGHIAVYSKKEEREITKLSSEDSAHLFFVASFAASALFDGLGAQGTNILLKSGFSDDNPEGKLCVHVLPRFQGDALQGILWQPKQPEYNLDDLAVKIKDKMWNVKYTESKTEAFVEQKKIIPPVLKIGEEKASAKSVEEEIDAAIRKMVQ
ncbi:HIT family protein [Candidatus Woesearchaeota archaeon]|nr:HIT family protein [Candidatus Woesearchaeota archaeon]